MKIPFARRTPLHRLLQTSFLVLSAFSTSSMASTKPDALLQIDLNRNAIIERITAAWSKELPASQYASFRTKLQELRADALLAANLSGSFEGVLEVLSAAESPHLANQATNAAQVQSVIAPSANSRLGDRSKALGEASRDLLYTPIAPCRVFDTRTPGTPFVSNGLTSGVTQTFDVDGANLSAQGGAATGCGIPTDARAVVLAFSPISPPTTGWVVGASNDGAPLPASTLFNYSANLTLTTFTVVLPMLGQAGGDIRLEARGVSAYSMHGVGDVTGYFMAPTRSGDGLRVIATAQGGPNIINGDSSNTITAADRATISGGSNNTNGGLVATISGGSGNQINGIGTASTIGGGENNTINGDRNTIAGGVGNSTGLSSSTVGGGNSNAASGNRSTVPGGFNNTAGGSNSFAAGTRGKAINDGAFVWSDFSSFDFSSSATNQFSARATGGFRFVSAIDAAGVPTKTFAIAPTTGNVTTPGRIDATDDLATAADVTASGNVSAGVDVLATRDVTATQNVVATNKFVAPTNKASATGAKAIGERYRDNSIIAWVRINSSATISQGFGIVSVVKNAVGNYTLTLDVTAASTTSIVPVANAQLDARPTSAASMRIVTVDTISTTAFNVYINDGTGAAADAAFIVIVTGR